MEHAEFEEKLGAVLVREVPGCSELRSAERLSGGASQETYRLTIGTGGGTELLCLRRAAGGIHLDQIEHAGEQVRIAPGLATEALLMRSAREVGVPEPEVHYVLQPGDGLGDGFVMQWLDGEALGARIARAEQFASMRPGLAFECGQHMARIHGIDLDATGLRERLEVSTPQQFVEQTWERYRLLDTPAPMIDFTGRWLMENLPEQFDLALVHNDFRNGNFMVDGQRINAVLDWEIAHIGDPMRDLGWICTNSWRFGVTELPVGGFGLREDLFAGYESISGQTVDPDHVKFWEVFGSFWWAVGCLGMAEHYRSGPDQTVERPAIGRRSSECQVDCVNLLIPGPVTLVEAASTGTEQDMPRADELLVSVRDFLRQEVMSETQGRIQFLSRVAGNSLDIVLRELSLGPPHRAQETQRLKAFLDSDEGLFELRWQLVNGLRDGSIALDAPGLAAHLRASVVNQIAIDQPRYSGFLTASSR